MLSCLLLLSVAGGFLPIAAIAEQAVREWHFDDIAASLLTKFIVGTFFDGRPSGHWKVIKSPKVLSSPHVGGGLDKEQRRH